MSPADDTTYDFVIVGAGVAGLVLARRLVDAGHHVLVLEAGPTVDATRKDVSMVALAPLLYAKSPELLWSYKTTPQPHLANREVPLLAGRNVGGGSNVNFGLWTRGDASAYARIAQVTGDASWDWPAMLPYFKRVETYHYPEPDHVDHTLHGHDGPIHVLPLGASHRSNVWAETAHKAFDEAGFQYQQDINSGRTVGIFGDVADNAVRSLGGRMSSNRYIGTSLRNLTILDLKPADKVLWLGKRAVGVLTSDGAVYHARKEVIVSCGGIGSPALLQRSGVGPASLLASLGIPLVHDSPGVGRNLWDHANILTHWKLKDEHRGGTTDDLRQPGKMQEALAEYEANGGGHLGGLPHSFTAWQNVANSDGVKRAVEADKTLCTNEKAFISSLSTAHLQFWCCYGYFVPPIPGEARIPRQDDHSYITLGTYIATPSSRGTVSIVSTSAHDQPAIDINWIGNEVDRQIMHAGLKICERLATGPAWGRVLDKEWEDSGAFGFSDEEMDEKIRICTNTVWHYSGTCAMAPLDSQDVIPVLDSQCRVHGVAGLRVVDTSAYPSPISANTQASAYVLAEKIADIIIAAYA